MFRLSRCCYAAPRGGVNATTDRDGISSPASADSAGGEHRRTTEAPYPAPAVCAPAACTPSIATSTRDGQLKKRATGGRRASMRSYIRREGPVVLARGGKGDGKREGTTGGTAAGNHCPAMRYGRQPRSPTRCARSTTARNAPSTTGRCSPAVARWSWGPRRRGRG